MWQRFYFPAYDKEVRPFTDAYLKQGIENNGWLMTENIV